LWSKQKNVTLETYGIGFIPNDWVFFALKPFDANHNDATILEDCFNR